MIGRIATPLALTLIMTTQVLAASPAEQRGKTFALTNCARCHSIDRVSPSPLKIAPPFRTLHLRYPIETLGRGAGRRHLHRSSDHAGVPARSRPDP